MRTVRMAAMERLMAAGVSRASAKASTFGLDYCLADGRAPLYFDREPVSSPDLAAPGGRVEAAVLCDMSDCELAGLSIGVRMRGGDLLSADMVRVIDDTNHRRRAGLYQYADERNRARRPSRSLHQELMEFSACIESRGDDGILRHFWHEPKPPITVPRLVPTMARIAGTTHKVIHALR